MRGRGRRGKKWYFLGENFSLKILSLLRSVLLHHPLSSSLFLSVSSSFGFLYRKFFLLLMNFFTSISYSSQSSLPQVLTPSLKVLPPSQREREREKEEGRDSLWFVFPIRSLLPSFSAFNVIPGGFI